MSFLKFLKIFILIFVLEFVIILFFDKTITNLFFYLYLNFEKIRLFCNIINNIFLPRKVILFLSLLVIIFFFIAKKKTNYINLFYFFKNLFFAVLITSLIVNILKIIFFRERPFFTKNPYKFFCFNVLNKNIYFLFKTNFKSFPSDHVATVTSFVCFLYFYAKDVYKGRILFLIKLVSILIILFVMFSRIAVKAHWLSDTIFSLFLGYFISRYIYKKMHLKLKIEVKNEISFN